MANIFGEYDDNWDQQDEFLQDHARYFCRDMLDQEFDEEYAHSFIKFVEAYADARYFYNFGCSSDSLSDTSGGAYPFYPSSIHVHCQEVILEDIEELTARMIAKTDRAKGAELGISNEEAAFPLVLPLSEARDQDIDWVSILMSHPAVAESSQQQLLSQVRSIGRCVAGSRRKQQLVVLDQLSSPSTSSSSLLSTSVSAAYPRAATEVNTVIESESLIYLAMMVGCLSLHRSSYDRLRRAFRDYIRSVLEKMWAANRQLGTYCWCSSGGNISAANYFEKAVITASAVQSVLQEKVLGFESLSRIRGGLSGKIKSLCKMIYPTRLLTGSSIKVLNDMVFLMIQRLVGLAPALDKSPSSAAAASAGMRVTVYEFDATQAFDEENISVLFVAKDEAEIGLMQSFPKMRALLDYNWTSAVRVIDDASVDEAIGKYLITELIVYARKDISRNVAAFEAGARDTSIGADIEALTISPEFVALVTLESHNTLLTAKAAIAIASALEYILCECIELGGNFMSSGSDFIEPHQIWHGIIGDSELLTVFDECIFRESSTQQYLPRFSYEVSTNWDLFTREATMGQSAYTGFMYSKDCDQFYHDKEGEYASLKSRKERKAVDLACCSETAFDIVPPLGQLASSDFNIFEQRGTALLCCETVRMNHLLCIGRGCVQNIIHEFFEERGLDRKDTKFTHEALNLLQTATESHLLAVLELAIQRSGKLVATEHIDGAVKDLSLWWACHVGDICNVRSVIALGANVNCLYRKATPLLFAARAGNMELVRELVEAGANIHTTAGVGGTNALTAAVLRGFKDVVEFMLARSGANDTPNRFGSRPAWFEAVTGGDVDMVDLFIRYGVDLNMRHQGCTALHKLCEANSLNMELVEYLIYNGADTTLVTSASKTAYDLLDMESDKERFLGAIETRDNPGLK